MINEQKLKLFMRMIEKNNKQSKHFLFDFSMQGNQIDRIKDELTLSLTDHHSTKYQMGLSVVVGEVKNIEDMIAFGIRTSDTTFVLDLVDMKNDAVYDRFIVVDIVLLNERKRFVEIDEKNTCVGSKINFVLKTLKKKDFQYIDDDMIASFENKVLDDKYSGTFFNNHLKTLLSSDKYMKDISNNMMTELQTMETKIYVNVIYNFFSRDTNKDIKNYTNDKKFAKEFKREINKGLLAVYKLFTKYPSEIFTLYDNIKANFKNDCVFPQFDDMTTYLK